MLCSIAADVRTGWMKNFTALLCRTNRLRSWTSLLAAIPLRIWPEARMSEPPAAVPKIRWEEKTATPFRVPLRHKRPTSSAPAGKPT
jgi:hypothetical protein